MKSYLGNVSEYAGLLKQSDNQSEDFRNISSIESQRKLRPLVSYYEYTDEEYNKLGITTPKQIFKVLAVKKVDIYTSFKVNGEPVGKIQFVDTPGIGEARIGVEQALADALRYDLDVAICLRKVSPQKGVLKGFSKPFHRILKQHTFGRKPETWVFYIYNKENLSDKDKELLESTYDDVNGDLANTPVKGLNGETIPGIKLRFDRNNASGINHIDFIDAEKEAEKLQRYFLDILSEMASTIAEADNTFYKDAREAVESVQKLYQSIVITHIRNISKYLPTFDEREKILGILNNVNNAWNKLDFPKTLKEQLRPALAAFYEEPYGIALAEALGLSGDDVNTIKDNVRAAEKNKEIPREQRIEQRKTAAKDVIFNFFEKEITEISQQREQLTSLYQGWFKRLSDVLVKKASDKIQDADLVRQIDASKNSVWDVLISTGQLDKVVSHKDGTKAWINSFIDILDDGGNDFSDLRDVMISFNEYTLDIGSEIAEIITTAISQNQIAYAVPNSPTSSLEDIRVAFFNQLYNAEKESKARIQSQCADIVNTRLSTALDNFFTELYSFLKKVIPGERSLLTYDPVFEQLIKFYNKYFTVIFSRDEQADQKLAVKEWEILQGKFNDK